MSVTTRERPVNNVKFCAHKAMEKCLTNPSFLWGSRLGPDQPLPACGLKKRH